MLSSWILAGMAVAVVAARPRSWGATLTAAGVACVDVARDGASVLGEAVRAVAPMALFLLVAISGASLAVRLGAARGAAFRLASVARGSGRRLFVLVCIATALLTALVSLDGAVVAMVPVLVELRRRVGAPLRPLLLGVVAVANASSLAVPEGNPTNLVVIAHEGLPLGRAAATMLVPGVVATVLCATAVAWCERRALDAPFVTQESSANGSPFGAGLLGAVRLVVQMLSLLVVVLALPLRLAVAGAGLPVLVGVAAGVSLLASLANNLPASAVVAAGLAPGPAAYAALVGLSVGALATPQGSVATLIAGDLAGEQPHAPMLLPTALAAALGATVVIWLTYVS